MMEDNLNFGKGTKVTYKNEFEEEKGIIKSLSGYTHAFVVYNCNNDWENYENYTAERTFIGDLEKGW